MSDALIVTFQSQLSIVMETILKSAMFEITKLVEDSFMEEVGHAKQEVELLMRRLQFYESKLKERERRVCCVDCGKTPSSGEKRAEQPAEAHPGADTLCFSLSLREQSGKRPPFSEVWRSAEGLDSCPPPETHTQPHAPTHAQTQAPAQAQTHTQAHVLTQKKTDTPEQSRKQDSVTNTSVQLPQHVLQKLLPNPAVTGNHEHCSSSKPRESHQHKTPGIDFIPSNEIDLTQSNRLMQSIAEKDVAAELSCSPPSPAMKLECEPDLLPIKEEEEMLPVWDCTDDSGPAESELNRRDLGGPWNHEETQVDNFPNLTTVNMPDPTSYLMSYSVKCNPGMSEGIKDEPGQSVHLAVASFPETSSSLEQFESGPFQSFPQGVMVPQELGSDGRGYPPVSPPHHSPQNERLQVCDNLRIKKPHSCVNCGKSFARVGHLRVHMLTHKGKKPFSCLQCNKTFVHNFELKDHERQHTGERPYVCGHCGKSFTRLGNFKQHQNIHTQERLFNCNYCGMTFKRSTHLRVHLRRHSRAGKSCPCRQCGKTFVCVKQLKGHLMKVHGTTMN
ncbi:zinc finger protein 500 isoform X1 [Astyanax mexicanus]|uniref:zinc finger protein 500 isoform X1 n=1 Tax=Astyanax mexicanus TaxID=7994 RepID=UPI0020CAF8FA|nr:zinc finger protein 500 isoform X1 [Astyanax mexicanus]